MKCVVLDPGHGGADNGTCHNGVFEASFVLGIVYKLECELAKHNIGCFLTRDASTAPTHHERAKVALDHCVNGVISIHVNSGAEGEHGPLGFFRDDDPLGMRAAQQFVSALYRQGEFVKNGVVKPMKWQVHIVRPDNWTVNAWNCIIHQPLPVFLAELEYCSHKPSATWLLSDLGQQQIVDALACAALTMVN